jgi:hypothetical protein
MKCDHCVASILECLNFERPEEARPSILRGFKQRLSNHSEVSKAQAKCSFPHFHPPDPEPYAGLDDIGPAIDGADAAGIHPGIPPIIPIPSPAGNAPTPHRQSQLHWPLFIVPVPEIMLADGIDELIGIDMDMAAVVMLPPIVSIARHAMSFWLGALMLNRMPSSQWSAWPQ